MHPRRILLVILLLTGGAACRVGAASAQESRDARAYWQALSRASTTTAAISAGRSGWLESGAGALVAEGMLRLRMYELAGSAIDAATGRQALERAVQSATRSAWAHFALGALLARGPDLRVRTSTGTYFTDAHSLAAKQAPRALQRALQLDPTLDEAALELATVALDVNDGRLLVSAERALGTRRLVTRTDALLLRARIAERLDAPERAAAVLDSAVTHGLDASVAAHERARSLFRVRGQADAALTAYFAGIDQLTDEGASTYFFALEPILSETDAARWRELDLTARRQWLRRFWDVTAALAGVSAAERITEHYRRLYEARVRFPLVHALGAEAGAGELVDPRNFGTTVSGLMHVRHGDAARINRVTRCGRGIDTIPPLLRPPIADCRTFSGSTGGMPAWQAELAGAEQRMRERQAREYAFRGESYYPPFRRDVPVAWELYQFRGAAGTTEVVAAIAAPSAALNPLEPQGPFVAQVGFMLVDTARPRVYRNQSTRTQPRATAGGDLIWTASLEVDPATALELRIAVSDDRREAGRVSRGEVAVRAFADDSLAVSDLVVAPGGGTATLQRGDVPLSLTPRRDYVRAERFNLYYEVYGLAQDATYRTELVLAPNVTGIWERLQSLAGRLPDVLRLEFTDIATAPHTRYGTQVVRSVDASALSPGDYRLRITTTAVTTGQRAVAERVVVIR